MTILTKSRTALGLAAIASAVLGCTAIAGSDDAETETRSFAQTAPIACTVTAENTGRGLVLQPVVQATEAVSGVYQLRIEGPGTRMNQGGPFSVRAGETEVLGRMTLSTSASSLTAEMILTIDGESFACPVDL